MSSSEAAGWLVGIALVLLLAVTVFPDLFSAIAGTATVAGDLGILLFVLGVLGFVLALAFRRVQDGPAHRGEQ